MYDEKTKITNSNIKIQVLFERKGKQKKDYYFPHHTKIKTSNNTKHNMQQRQQKYVHIYNIFFVFF